MAPELLTIKPIRNNVLKPNKMQNIAYGLDITDLKFAENKRMIKIKRIRYVSTEASIGNTLLQSLGNGRTNGFTIASQINNKLPEILCGTLETEKVMLPGEFKK